MGRRRIPARIFGIDFSGAKDAGRKIWIAKGENAGGSLYIDSCCPASELPGSGRERDTCLKALTEFVKGQKDAALGFDFPFGLPESLVEEESWAEFAAQFSARYRDPEEFRAKCRRASPGRELKRKTDEERRTPFSPYNIRLFRQTFYGIALVLAPLVRLRLACVLPMQEREDGKPWILEVCPASTLKDFDLYDHAYKGKEEKCRGEREEILSALMGVACLRINADVRNHVLEDANGDALDSVVAALATLRALHTDGRLHGVEGYVY